MRLWIVALGILFIDCAMASEDWVAQTPTSTSDAYYFKGYGSSKELSQAINNAKRQALEDAIQQLYGFSTRIDLKTYETSRDSKIIKRYGEVSHSININDFKLYKLHKEYKDNQFIVTALYEYKKQAVKDEQARISRLPDDLEVQLIAIKSEDKKQSYSFTTDSGEAITVGEVKSFWDKNIHKIEWFQASLLGGVGSKTVDGELGIELVEYGLNIELFFRRIGVNAGYSIISEGFFGNDSGNDSIASDAFDLKGSRVYLAVSIYFSTDDDNKLSAWFIEPNAGRLEYEVTKTRKERVSCTGNPSCSAGQNTILQITESSADIEQIYSGLNVGYRYYNPENSWGLGFRLGLKQYEDSNNYKGVLSADGSISITIGF